MAQLGTEVGCPLVTGVSVGWLHAPGGPNNILWPGCPQASDADAIPWQRAKVSPASGRPVPWESLHEGRAAAALSQTHSSALIFSDMEQFQRFRCFQPFCCPMCPGLEGVLKKVLTVLCTAILNCLSLSFVLAQAF